jgi:DNA-directed RNA polymerase specialized sigma24 family protein
MIDSTEYIVEFTLIFNGFKKKLYNYVLKMTADIMLTEDIVQDTFLKLYQNLKISDQRQYKFLAFYYCKTKSMVITGERESGLISSMLKIPMKLKFF